MASRYADAIHLSKKQWAAIETELNAEGDGKAQEAVKLLSNRLSKKRCKERLVAMVREGQLRLGTPEALYAWTYGAATVAGAKPEGVAGKKEPLVNISETQ